jgi:hypothetical protein
MKAIDAARTDSASDLLERAIAAHGGERFDRATEIVIRARAGGLAQRSKRFGRVIGDFEVRCSTREQRSVLSDYPRRGRRGVFERSEVRIESAEDGSVLARRADPRSLFPGGRRQLWWDDLDFLYFAGYAMWGYANAPFLLKRTDVDTREIEPWREGGRELRRVEAVFPPELQVHSRRQVFYFDDDGLLRRNDYDPEVFGGWVHSAHCADEHREFDGLVFATRRRVYGRRRNGTVRRFPTFIRIDVTEVEVL